MKVAVWDTYVKRADGSVLHFDIVAPDSVRDEAVVFSYGQTYLAARGETGGRIESETCQLCHIESPTEDMLMAIERQGYYILEMEDIPAQLPAQPGRRDMILHLRAHEPVWRFADFKDKSTAEIEAILKNKG